MDLPKLRADHLDEGGGAPVFPVRLQGGLNSPQKGHRKGAHMEIHTERSTRPDTQHGAPLAAPGGGFPGTSSGRPFRVGLPARSLPGPGLYVELG